MIAYDNHSSPSIFVALGHYFIEKYDTLNFLKGLVLYLNSKFKLMQRRQNYYHYYYYYYCYYYSPVDHVVSLGSTACVGE